MTSHGLKGPECKAVTKLRRDLWEGGKKVPVKEDTLAQALEGGPDLF